MKRIEEKIYNLLKRKLEPNIDEMNTIFYLIGSIFIFCIFFTDKQDPSSYQYIFSMIGMVIVFILLVYNSIKNIPPLEFFLRIPITKFLLTVSLSGYIIYSTAEVSIIINSIFKVSSSNFKVSTVFGTFFYFLNHLIKIFWWFTLCIICILVLSYLLNSYEEVKNDYGEKVKSRWNFKWDVKCWYLIIFLLFFLGLSHYSNLVVDHNAIKYKIFRLAIQYDFDTYHSCTNIDKKYSVLYIGNQQNKVLVNSIYSANFSNFENFMTEKNYINFIKNLDENLITFQVMDCEYIKYNENPP